MCRGAQVCAIVRNFRSVFLLALGYTLRSVKQTNTGLTASLGLAGAACNAFGHDITNLTIQVTYETSSRYVLALSPEICSLTSSVLQYESLHVHIFDTANKQYTIPESVVERPPAPTKSFKSSSDLVFNYESSPFAFWITRRSQPHAAPLFDTRIASFPKTPIPAVIPTDNTTALDGFPLVFEDQYLQVCISSVHNPMTLQVVLFGPQIASVLPLNTNIYGLGEVVASSGFRRDVDATIQTMWARDIADPVDQNV